MKIVKLILSVLTFITILYTANSSQLYGQSARVKFDKKVHDFGDILITSGHHTCKFIITNISKEPIVIQTIISSCGCTTPIWSKSPIMPNKSGEIEVTFLNDQGPYPFDKVLTVYITGENRPHLLRIKGVVHDKKRAITELFPEKYSSLALRKAYLDFGIIPKGENRIERIELVNISKKVIEIVPNISSNNIKVSPNKVTLSPSERKFIDIEIITSHNNLWGSNEEVLFFNINSTTVQKEFLIKYNIRDNFFNLSPQEIQNGPIPMASSSSNDFGSIKKGAAITSKFRVRNIGKRELIIHKIDSNIPGVSIKYNNSIEVGKTTDINITIDTNHIETIGEVSYILTLITNSPTRPIINYIVSGNITK